MKNYNTYLDGRLSTAETMKDYNTYLDGLMAAFRKSVQSSPHQPPQDLARPPKYGESSIKDLQAAARARIAPDRAAMEAEAANTSRKVEHAATASRLQFPKNLPPAQNAPRPRVPETLPPRIAAPHANVHRIIPPLTAAPNSAIPEKHLPKATAPLPFAPIPRLPIEVSNSAYGPHKAEEPVTPTSEIERRKTRRERHMGDIPDKSSPMRYRNMPQRAMRKELKRRGLYSHGANPDLVKRLEQDDEFQAGPRTAETYDTMDPKDIRSLCVSRLIPALGATSFLRDRLKAHDKRGDKKEPTVPRLSPPMSPSGQLPGLEIKASQKMLDEKPPVPTSKDEPASRREKANAIGETLAAAKPKNGTFQVNKMHNMLPGNIHQACQDCSNNHRRCRHDINGNEDPTLVAEPAVPRHTAGKGYNKDKNGVRFKKPAQDTEVVTPKCATQASQDDEKPGMATEELIGTRIMRPRRPNPKEAASQDEMSTLEDAERVSKGVETRRNVSSARQKPVLFVPKDEISLLQICVKLKEVIAWGRIQGFWTMVQDTLEVKTGKQYKKVSRHVRILVDKRRAEQHEIEHWGKISKSRVSAGCRPLLDKWIAGGNRKHVPSPKKSKKPVLRKDKKEKEEKEDTSLGKEGGQQLNSNDSTLEVRKRSATDAWLDTSCDTNRSKQVKLGHSELTPTSSISHANSAGCWSLSGSSVTSESSLEDEDEDEDEDDVKSGEYQ